MQELVWRDGKPSLGAGAGLQAQASQKKTPHRTRESLSPPPEGLRLLKEGLGLVTGCLPHRWARLACSCPMLSPSKAGEG
jgi:hypothetical protein